MYGAVDISSSSFFRGKCGWGFSVFVFLSDVVGGFESLNIMMLVPKPLPSPCFAPAFPLSCCPWLCVFEWNIGTASVTEHTSPQVLLMVQDEKQAFGLDYSHSVTDTPHTHPMHIESQCAGLKREVKSGSFFIALITILATLSLNSPGHGFQTSFFGLLVQWYAALYKTLYTTSYTPLISLQSLGTSYDNAWLCAVQCNPYFPSYFSFVLIFINKTSVQQSHITA